MENMIFEPVLNTYNKIYARANAQSIVTHIFSEAFEQPTERDICIDEFNTDRHGANEYQVYDESGIANYAIVDGKLVERDKTAELRQISLNSLRRQREPLLVAFDKWEKAVIRGRERDSNIVMTWYEDLLDLKDKAFTIIPECIKYYL